MAMPKVAIIGAGPVGCMLARILSLSDIPVTVYESDCSPDYRSQGGTLDLHPKTGLAALKEARLFDQFKSLARYDGDAYTWTDKDGTVLLKLGGGKAGAGERPEIDRSDLRRMLTESLPAGTIRWGRRLRRVEDDGTLVWADGAATAPGRYDLVVGCEGAWSKVRNHLTDARPHHLGLGYYLLRIADAAAAAPALARLVGGGNLFAHHEGQKLSVQQLRNGSLHVAWSFRAPEDWLATAACPAHDPDRARDAILAQMHDWSPALREAIEKARDTCEPKNLYALPVGWRWEHRRGFTAIGDAAHLMAPFAGEGVNVGLDDARQLAAAIIRAARTSSSPDGQGGGGGASGGGQDGGHGGGGGGRNSSSMAEELDRHVRRYEEDMFPRMARYQQLTHDVTRLWLFTDGDVRRVLPAALLCHARMEMPAFAHPFAYVGLHAAWWLRSWFL